MPDKKRPGYNSDAQLYTVPRVTMERIVGKFLRYIKFDTSLLYADIGNVNPKMELIKELTGIQVEQIAVDDFNFDELPKRKLYDVIFCLEVLEHLQNPLFLMRELRSILKDDGVIYLTMPSNPLWLKYDYHYNELRKKDLVKWILNPMSLRLIRHEKYNFMRNWRAALIGIRPVIRGIKNRDFRPIAWALVQINNFYEIRKDI